MSSWPGRHPTGGTTGAVEPGRRARALSIAALLPVVAVAGMLAGATHAVMAAGPNSHGQGSSGSTPSGNDISWPQCGGSFPSGQAFGIVGVNDGLANNLNPCFGTSTKYPSYAQSELYWAVVNSSGRTTQPNASLYVNTGDPGNVYNGSPIRDWPQSGSTPYGSCSTTTVTLSGVTYTVGQNSTSCAWEYGKERASQDAAWLTQEADLVNAQKPGAVSDQASAYPWWLDVETGNTWQTGTSGQAMNAADLQGMIAGLDNAGGGTSSSPVGIYSTSYQWGQITGGTTSGFSGVPDWIPGAGSLSGAQSNCGLTSFTAGKVVVTQWSSHSLDSDYAC